MALGGCLPELFYASLAIVAGDFVMRHPQVAKFLDYALAVVFLGVGIAALLRKPQAPQNSILRTGQTRGAFWQGLGLAMINPQLLPFWFGVYVYAQRTLFPLGSVALQLCFVCGTAFGAWLLLFVLVQATHRHRENILTWLQRYNSGRVLGWMFIVLALWKLLALAV